MKSLWILYILFVLFAIAFLMIALLTLRPYQKTTLTNTNTLQNAYLSGDGSLAVEYVTNPFSVNARQRGRTFQAATFSAVSDVAPVFSNFVVGNDFTVSQPCEITGLQIVFDFLSQTTITRARQVAVYNKDTQVMIANAEVGVDDPVIAGFYTQLLVSPVELKVGVKYGIFAVLDPSDRFARDMEFTQSSNLVSILNRSATLTNTMQIPPNSDIVPTAHSIQFASFQFVVASPIQSVWDVDVRSTYATFPINYIYNCNVQVKQDYVEIEPGLCISDAQNNNMLNNTIGNLKLQPTVVGQPNGLDVGVSEINQWYAVYLITSTVQGKPPAGLLSKNRQQPSFMPVGYESSRRIGWARTSDFVSDENKAITRYLPTIQQGNGVRRQTVYKEPWPLTFARTFAATEIRNATFSTMMLDFVTPTCTSMVLQLVVDNTANTATVDITFREPGAFFGFLTVVAAASSVSISTVELPILSFYSPHRLDLGLANTQYEIASSVDVKLYVQSFFDNV